MDDSQYKYLDDERVKLWAELRRTQEQLDLFIKATSGDQATVEKWLRSLGVKAASAYKRINERDVSTETLVAELRKNVENSQEVAEQATVLGETLKASTETVKKAEQRISEGVTRFDEEQKAIATQMEELAKRLADANEYVETAERQHSELQAEVEDFSDKYEASKSQHAEISKYHSLLFGYKKSDGEIVEGKTQELEKAYDELELKIASTKTDADNFESECKQRIADFLTAAKNEADVLAEKVRGLLPDAMTAGLSAAYLANRKMEEDEQGKQLKLFKWCIGGMMCLALLPISVNFYLWQFCGRTAIDILTMLPREMMLVMPIYIPLFWLAIFANKRVNLSKRLIEEYKHKEAVSKTYEGLAKQIDALGDDKASKELRFRLLYNTVVLSEKNPGELIKHFNRPDNPLIDVLNHGTKFTDSISKLKQIPGFDAIAEIAKIIAPKEGKEPQRDQGDEA